MFQGVVYVFWETVRMEFINLDRGNTSHLIEGIIAGRIHKKMHLGGLRLSLESEFGDE